MERKIKVAVIFGGMSSEHEVSIASALNVIGAINKDKYDVIKIGITKTGQWISGDHAIHYLASKGEQALLPAGLDKLVDEAKRFGWDSDSTVEITETANISGSMLPTKVVVSNSDKVGKVKLSEVDVVLPIVHGATGEDGAIQGFCKLANIPVVGCEILASAVAYDKIIANQIFDAVGIEHAPWLWFTKQEIFQNISEISDRIDEKLGSYPVFTKPANSGSSIGICKVHNRSELVPALELACKYDRRVVIEKGLNGRELEIAVLGEDQIFVSKVVAEIIPAHEFYDYESKYIESGSKTIVPANVPKSVIDRMAEAAKKAFRAIDGRGMARIDFFWSESDDKVYLNEINTIPGFTKISMYPVLMEKSGIPYSELIERLICDALRQR